MDRSVFEAQREWVRAELERCADFWVKNGWDHEHGGVYTCLDRKGKLLACKRLGEGSVASADLDVRRLVENAILTGASAVILAHNHPSGVALPSDGDYTATMRVRAALNAIGIELADHIIVADGDFVSMADSGYLS